MLSVYVPWRGSGGMLAIAKEPVTAGETRGGEPCAPAVNPDADTTRRHPREGTAGLVAEEIICYFYEQRAPRPIEEIEAANRRGAYARRGRACSRSRRCGVRGQPAPECDRGRRGRAG